MERKTIQKRRQAWADAARRLPHQNGPSTKRLSSPGKTGGYSFLGAGLQACIDRDPGCIEWNEPQTAGDGEIFQSVDDTTETIANYYAISTEIVNLLDQMEQEGYPTEKLNMIMEQAAGRTVSIQPSGQSDPNGEKGKGQPEGQPGPTPASRIEWKITPKEDTFFLEVLTTSEHRPEMKHRWVGEIEIWPEGDTQVNYMALNYINQETPKAEVENPHAIHVYPGEGRKRSLRQDCENIAQQCYEETQRLERTTMESERRQKLMREKTDWTREKLLEIALKGPQALSPQVGMRASKDEGDNE